MLACQSYFFMKALGCSLLIAVLTLAGCATRPTPRPADTAPDAVKTVPTAAPKIPVLKELAGTAWVLIELGEIPVAPTPEDWSPQSLEFSKTGLQITGNAGVNRFGARYAQYDAELSFGPLALTRRLGPPELMSAEQRYTTVLSRVIAWRQEGAQLVLITPGYKRAAVLERVPPVKK
jgi:heat shock protein HslJ